MRRSDELLKISQLFCFLLCSFCIHQQVQAGTIEGEISYSGSATGIVLVTAITNLSTEDELIYEWETEVDGAFTNTYSLTNVDAGTYYVIALLETNDFSSATDPWGHYMSWQHPPQPIIATANGTNSEISFLLIEGSISNNPYSGGGGCTNDLPVCDGPITNCLIRRQDWVFEGIRVSASYFFDTTILPLTNNMYRLFGNSTNMPLFGIPAFESYISSNGLAYTHEPGYRFEEAGCFMPNVLRLTNGDIRCYYTDQSIHPNGGDGGRAIRSALSTNEGWTFLTEGDNLTYLAGTMYEANGIRGAKVLDLGHDIYRMYYHAVGSNNHWRVLSAISTGGLVWARESGVRLDPIDYCPEARRIGNMAPYRSFNETGCHLFITLTRCEEDYCNQRAGLFVCPSVDGLNFTVPEDPIAQNYYIAQSYSNNPTDPQITVQDPCICYMDNGTRIYFGVYNGGEIITNVSGIYSLYQTDFDGDRQIDYDEFIAGTDPNNSNSVFTISASTRSPDDSNIIIQWSSESNKHYSVGRTTNALADHYTLLATNITAIPPANTYTDTTASSSETYFYRIAVSP